MLSRPNFLCNAQSKLLVCQTLPMTRHVYIMLSTDSAKTTIVTYKKSANDSKQGVQAATVYSNTNDIIIY